MDTNSSPSTSRSFEETTPEGRNHASETAVAVAAAEPSASSLVACSSAVAACGYRLAPPQPSAVMLAVLPPYGASCPLSLAEHGLRGTVVYRSPMADISRLPLTTPTLQLTSPVDMLRPQQLVIHSPPLLLPQVTPVSGPAAPGHVEKALSAADRSSASRTGTPSRCSSAPQTITTANFPLSPHGTTRISPIAATPMATAAAPGGPGTWVQTASGHLAFVRPDYAPAVSVASHATGQRGSMDLLSPNNLLSPNAGAYSHAPQTRPHPAASLQQANSGQHYALYPGGQPYPALGQSRGLPPGYMMAALHGHAGLPAALALSRFQATKRARECTKPLKEWLLKNRRKPYPTRMEKAHLRDMTGLTFNQVSMWFANARRRIKKVGIESWARAALSSEDPLLNDESWMDQEETSIDSEDKDDDTREQSDQYQTAASPQQSYDELQAGPEQTQLGMTEDDDTITRSSIRHGFSPMPQQQDVGGNAGADFARTTPALDYRMPGKTLHAGDGSGNDGSCFQLSGYLPDRMLANLDTPRSPRTMAIPDESMADHEPAARRPYNPAAGNLRSPLPSQQQQPPVEGHSDHYMPSTPVEKPAMYFYSQGSDQQMEASVPGPVPQLTQATAVAPATTSLPALGSPPATLYQTATPYYHGLPTVSLVQPSYVIPQHVTAISGGGTAALSAPYMPDTSVQQHP